MVKWRLLTVGGLISFVGSVLWKASTSPWMQANLRSMSDFLASGAIFIQVAILVGAAEIGIALFWGRWGLAFFASTIFVFGAFFFAFVL